MQPVPGHILRHTRFYLNDQGEWLTKYLMVLGIAPGGDIVFRLLTSQPHSRPEIPPCYHGHPYSSFYLGVLGPPLGHKSWLDLRPMEAYEEGDFRDAGAAGTLTPVLTVSRELLCAALDCAARAQDTTRQQERAIREQRAALNCP